MVAVVVSIYFFDPFPRVPYYYNEWKVDRKGGGGGKDQHDGLCSHYYNPMVYEDDLSDYYDCYHNE
jgi:hypothetical protein